MKKVDFKFNRVDRKVKEMMAKRFTYKLMARKTGLTIGQVNYRVYLINQRTGITLPYRQGKTEISRRTLAAIERNLERVDVFIRQLQTRRAG